MTRLIQRAAEVCWPIRVTHRLERYAKSTARRGANRPVEVHSVIGPGRCVRIASTELKEDMEGCKSKMDVEEWGMEIPTLLK